MDAFSNSNIRKNDDFGAAASLYAATRRIRSISPSAATIWFQLETVRSTANSISFLSRKVIFPVST